MANHKKIIKVLSYCFFLVAFFEVMSEFFSYKPLILFFKPLIPILIITMYLLESNVKNKLFVFIMFLSVLTNLLFIPNTKECLFFGLIAFTFHRLLVVTLLIRLNNFKDYVPILIATAPFLIIFFYLFFETPNIPQNSFLLLVLQNIMISVFAGISLSVYVMLDDKKNSILLISALLFVMLQFAVFIEKYYLNNEYSEVLRPLAMTLNSLAFFSFYKYIMETEASTYKN